MEYIEFFLGIFILATIFYCGGMLIWLIFFKEFPSNDINNYPGYIIGSKYYCQFIATNPFEKDFTDEAIILDMKENDKGETYVKYMINGGPTTYIEGIDTFATWYKQNI